ncbi:MAG: CHAD domain-containing protein [Acidobacteriota bacterium]|nr:CHAD domain-containing protein [Acidobacteriota bacterium]
MLDRRVEAFAKVLPRLRDGDVEGIHRARVATRRLREALPVVAAAAPQARKLRRTLRDLGRALGAVRELDVSLQLIEELDATGRFERASLDRVGRALAADRAAAWAAARQAIDEIDLESLMDRLRATVAVLRRRPARRPAVAAGEWLPLLRLRASRRAEELTGAVDAAGALYLPERLHQVRIAVKKLRYARELIEEAAGARQPGARLRLLKDLQETLGRLHDLQVLIDRTRQLQASMPQPRLTAWSELHILQRALEDACRERHAAYMSRRDALVTAVEAWRLPASATRRDRPSAPGTAATS